MSKPHVHWFNQPDGCDVSPRCLNCPLPQCRFDDPAAYQHWVKTHGLHGRILELTAAGELNQTIAHQAGCALRTVYRVLAAQKA